MIKYSSEDVKYIKDQLLPLHQDHFKGDYREQAADLNIDWDTYSELYDKGLLVAIVARDGDRIVGYMTSILSQHQQIKDKTQASMDTMYVDPNYRGKGIASSMFELTEEILEDTGVSWFYATFRDETIAEAVVGKYGYKKVECTFGKSLRSK